MFMHWLKYGLIHVIEILLSNVLVYKRGGGFHPFVEARIVKGIKRFVADGMMVTPDSPGNVIGRGRVGALNEVFNVDHPAAIQKTKSVLEFCTRFGNGMSLPHTMDFSYLLRTWEAANLMLRDLIGPAVDHAVDPNNRRCPVCLDPVLLKKFGILACGHPMHMSCWRLYRDRMTAPNRVVACLVCQFDTLGYCYQVRIRSIGKLRGEPFRGIVSKEKN
jgi:hypothetical protein